MNIQEIAQQYSEFFTTEEDKTLVKPDLSEENHGLARNLIHSVEGGLDWNENKLLLNEFISEALNAIRDTDDIDDITLEADPYDCDLYNWVGSDSQNENFVDDCVSDHLVSLPEPFNLTELLRSCQQQRKFEILRGVVSYLEEELEKLEEEEEEEKEPQYTVDKWEERDRLCITLWRGESGNDQIAQWWDDDARQLFEDGFFDPKNLLESVIEYCKTHGIC